MNAEKIIEKVFQFAMMLEKRHQKQGWKKVMAHIARLMENLGNDPILTDEVLQTIPNPVKLCQSDQEAFSINPQGYLFFAPVTSATRQVPGNTVYAL